MSSSLNLAERSSSRAESEPSPTEDGDSEPTRHLQLLRYPLIRGLRDHLQVILWGLRTAWNPLSELVASLSRAFTNWVLSSSNSVPCPGRVQQEETTRPAVQSRGGATGTDQSEEMVITSIRATDVALGLRRLPASFYTAVRHSGLEWRTENKRPSVNVDFIEWTGPIPIPPDLSTDVHLEVYASFECQPMLGAGEELRNLTVTVGELLHRNAADASFTFFPKEGDVVSPCSSVLVTVERQMSSPGSRGLLPHQSPLESSAELEDTTNQGHNALSRYRKRGERRDLELSIAKFEQALNICPLDHPSRAAALPNFTLQRSFNLQNTLKGLVREEREGHRVKMGCVGWETLLAPLWKSIVRPVLDALAFSILRDRSCIFWCPTGPFTFLPFHAAGLYDDPYSQLGHKVFDFVVSSYTPSLAILAPSPNPTRTLSDNLCFLVVRQPATDGQGPLPGVVTELEHIKEAVQKLPSVHATLVEPSIGTVEEVLSLMNDADWVHFACHGVQDGINSGLCLADSRRLKVRDMIAVSRPRGGLAFLSACQTAKGENRLSDEAIHIAAGMLFAGYGGAIGTMWSISDKLLHDAIGDLRDRVVASFDKWIPFIHVGL